MFEIQSLRVPVTARDYAFTNSGNFLCTNNANAVLAFASGCTGNKDLLTSQALPESESFCGFMCKLLLFLGHCFAVKTENFSFGRNQGQRRVWLPKPFAHWHAPNLGSCFHY